MFDSADYPQSLSEDQFDAWLEKGRESKIRYELMLIVWDDFEKVYQPIYAANKAEAKKLNIGQWGETVENEAVIAVYDLYSEARIYLPS